MAMWSSESLDSEGMKWNRPSRPESLLHGNGIASALVGFKQRFCFFCGWRFLAAVFQWHGYQKPRDCSGSEFGWD